MPGKKQVTRRAALGLIAGGGLLGASETLGFSNVTANRGVSVSTADDPNAIVGLNVNGTVQKNQRERLVDITNNTTDLLEVTVSLDTTDQTTLYGPNGSGDTVTLSLPVGDTKTVEIESGLNNSTISFTISATSSSGFGFEATRTTEAQAGSSGGGSVTANAGGSDTVPEGGSVELDGTGSTTSKGNIQSYTWEIISGPGSLSSTSGSTPVYNAPSDVQSDTDVTVELTVTNTQGSSDTDQTTITVRDSGSGNQAPIARFSSSRKGNSDNVTLDASASSDPDGTIQSYEWDEGVDGNVEYTGQTIEKQIPSGTEVKLIVTDDDGATDSVTKTV